ncbi:hypothetical protein [Arthrobacter sp. U41]|uniref:hypothetical protein n=1 Tax=Arthrobacter sp. U41 TaxID=1849032 RepID=UPI000859488E|nr:hypothetical protein [Arthrobacter sp. U41]AOT03114.1 hypothetical protein ASPU41_06930 [Arthrobacter sp. U41]
MEYIAVLLPSVVVGLIFWFAMKSIFNADKSERQAEARAQAEADEKAQAPHTLGRGDHSGGHSGGPDK